MDRYLIAGNWKMNKTTAEALEFADAIKNAGIARPDEVAIIAPFTQLLPLKQALSGSGIRIGAQNVHYEPKGAYTGEISISMLEEIGVDYCVIGHSERREYFNENDDSLNLKVRALLASSITPILCVGESLDIREAGNAESFVGEQICHDLENIGITSGSDIVIAYEPIWAIGTGVTATPDQAEEMCAFIRSMLTGLYGDEIANDIIIQYGGSMKPENAKDILSKPNINGGLIGGASLKVDDFTRIAEVIVE